ncbi:MAG: hypothetical protein ACREFO_07690 [Acetobacteraceae bacterium]
MREIAAFRRKFGYAPLLVNVANGSFDTRGGTFRTDLRVERDRPGESALQAIVRAIANDPDGIGYSGFGYALPGVKTVALAEHPVHRQRLTRSKSTLRPARHIRPRGQSPPPTDLRAARTDLRNA